MISEIKISKYSEVTTIIKTHFEDGYYRAIRTIYVSSIGISIESLGNMEIEEAKLFMKAMSIAIDIKEATVKIN